MASRRLPYPLIAGNRLPARESPPFGKLTWQYF
jgi:hypothetical protein